MADEGGREVRRGICVGDRKRENCQFVCEDLGELSK